MNIQSLSSSLHSVLAQPLHVQAERISTAGSVFGFATMATSFIRPLRPLALAGLGFISRPSVAALLLASGTYLFARELPSTYRTFLHLTQAGNRSRNQNINDVIQVAGSVMNGLGLCMGVASFGVGARFLIRTSFKALQEGKKIGFAFRTGLTHADTVRRAVNDPNLWNYFARGNRHLTQLQRNFLKVASWGMEQGLNYGSALLGVSNLAFSLNTYHSHQWRDLNTHNVASLLFQLANDVSPAVTMHLYRAGRGSENFDFRPQLSQEVSTGDFYDVRKRREVIETIQKDLPPCDPDFERRFKHDIGQELLKIQRLLDEAETLSLPAAQSQPQIPASKSSATGPVAALTERYRAGEVSPVQILEQIQKHASAASSSIYPRPLDQGPLGRKLLQLAQESERRFFEGKPRELEGIFVAVKDIIPGVDGLMNVGTKTGQIAGVESSPVLQILLEHGAIPVPVGMVAAANGGWGGDAGFGYIPHPTRPGYDPSGSSSGPAFVVGHSEIPIHLAIGTDTGGSVSAPAGAVGSFGFVPPSEAISTRNMIPYAQFLDRIGILSTHPEEGMHLARLLSQADPQSPNNRYSNPESLYHEHPGKPRAIYLKSLVESASPEARNAFLHQVQEYQRQGVEVLALGAEWDFLATVPVSLYPIDSYAAAAFSFVNPRGRSRYEPPRRTLDRNLLVRLQKARMTLENHSFDIARVLSERLERLVQEKLGNDVALISPAAEAIETDLIRQGRAGALLDGQDFITMLKNRMRNWGQMTWMHEGQDQYGISVSGNLPLLLRLLGLRSRPQKASVTKLKRNFAPSARVAATAA